MPIDLAWREIIEIKFFSEPDVHMFMRRIICATTAVDQAAIDKSDSPCFQERSLVVSAEGDTFHYPPRTPKLWSA